MLKLITTKVTTMNTPGSETGLYACHHPHFNNHYYYYYYFQQGSAEAENSALGGIRYCWCCETQSTCVILIFCHRFHLPSRESFSKTISAAILDLEILELGPANWSHTYVVVTQATTPAWVCAAKLTIAM